MRKCKGLDTNNLVRYKLEQSICTALREGILVRRESDDVVKPRTAHRKKGGLMEEEELPRDPAYSQEGGKNPSCSTTYVQNRVENKYCLP